MTFIERLVHGQFVDPSTALGAAFYALLFLIGASLVARGLRLSMSRLQRSAEAGIIDSTAAGFITQLAQTAVYVIAAILYAHLVPALHALGTAMLAGASVASIVIGLAAQSTFANLVAGLALVLYRPFSVGERLQMNVPEGVETAVVEALTLGYTVLRIRDDRRIIVPNSLMASQVTIKLPPGAEGSG